MNSPGPATVLSVDERLVAYAYFFNIAADYYECHEYLESLWLDSGRPVVLKGLIQAAVSLYHLQGGNVRGGYPMWLRARAYLAPHLPLYEGIDLESLTQAIDDVFARVPAEFHRRVVDPAAIAELHLPQVKLTLRDPELGARMATWRPPVGAEHENDRS
ncbi:MAG: DUF309 domain-containing protein [Firmicutes bacterium]|nr:DUF309 domain-containing protein [Bacillota bacterium]